MRIFEGIRMVLRGQKHGGRWKNSRMGFQKSGKMIHSVQQKKKKGIEVHTIGRIDKNIYKCVTENIVTDEVIITDERIAHIQERHLNDYERFYKCLKEIVEYPQYIVETNKPYTALILKDFVEGEE